MDNFSFEHQPSPQYCRHYLSMADLLLNEWKLTRALSMFCLFALTVKINTIKFGVICFWSQYSELTHKPLKYSWKHKINTSLNRSTTACKWQSILREACICQAELKFEGWVEWRNVLMYQTLARVSYSLQLHSVWILCFKRKNQTKIL